MPQVNPPNTTSIEEKKLALEYEKMAQEKYLKEKELEIELLQSKKSVWTTPWITALIAGTIGLLGTLWNSHQGYLIERKKEEGTLILEAIKTGTGETKRAAANLLFLDKAELIELKKSQRNELEKEAGANLLPSLPSIKETISYESSSEVTTTTKETLQNTIDSYLSYLIVLGYQKSKKGLNLFINPELVNNIFYNPELERIEISPRFISSKDGVLHQYTTRILLESSIAAKSQDTLLSIASLVISLSDYFTCSYQNDPIFGEDFIKLLTTSDRKSYDSPYLRNLSIQKKIKEEFSDPYSLAEVWGSAFWEIRNKIGKSVTDKLLFLTWQRISKDKITDLQGHYFFSEIIQADKDINKGQNVLYIQSILKDRGID